MARRGQIDLFTKRVRRSPSAPEFALQCMVADTLKRWSKPDWRHTHLPLGEYRLPATAGRLKRAGVIPGWADFILLSPTGHAHFLELKRRGGRLSEAQRLFAQYCDEYGYPYEVVERYDEALEVLRSWGALRSEVRVSA